MDENDDLIHPVAQELMKRARTKQGRLDVLSEASPVMAAYSVDNAKIEDLNRKAGKYVKDPAYQKLLQGLDPQSAANIVESLGYADPEEK